MKTLLLDNYDSFTFNLYQYLGELGAQPVVHRNDTIGLEEINTFGASHIVIGPGPGNPYTPRDIGIGEALIAYAVKNTIPLLGVCLGHQLLGKYLGAKVIRAPSPCHGKASIARILTERPLFTGLPPSIETMRYHSLCVEPESIPSTLRITAMSEEDVIMAMQHHEAPLFGIQFHPESVGTPHGKTILRNFLSTARL